jgi:hypothetical protein
MTKAERKKKNRKKMVKKSRKQLQKKGLFGKKT